MAEFIYDRDRVQDAIKLLTKAVEVDDLGCTLESVASLTGLEELDAAAQQLAQGAFAILSDCVDESDEVDDEVGESPFDDEEDENEEE